MRRSSLSPKADVRRGNDDATLARLADQRGGAHGAALSPVLDYRGLDSVRAHRRSAARACQHIHPADSDSTHASGDIGDTRIVHLRDQRADVLGGRLVRAGIPRRGLLVRIFRSDPVQHHLVGAFCAPAPEARLTRSMPHSERIFSFEFFPPATPEGVAKLRTTREQLARLGAKFFSVTYGAVGSTRDRTLATVQAIKAAGHSAARPV